jgi:prepilin-type N-terminal cleavage/methylation domain-containing protein
MSLHTSSNSKAGFTLLEVLVSVAIMALIMLLVWSTQSQSLNSKERIEKRDLLYQYGRVALEKIANDISMAFLTKKPGTPSVPAEGVAAPPIVAELVTVPRPITFFIGEDEGDRDRLRLTSMSHLRLISGGKESDQAKIMYEVESSAEEQGVMNLMRTETPWLDAETEVKGIALVLAENVRDFDLEYYDDRKEEWDKLWNTEIIDYTGRLPRAVRITLSLPDPDDDEKSITFRTIVLLPMSSGLIDF